VYTLGKFDRFNPSDLFRALASDECPLPLIGSDPHALYFTEYLEDIGAQTIVVEPEYVDGDYLEDYAAFYVACFHPYERFCRRVHFFKKDFDKQYFEERLRGPFNDDEYKAFSEAYLGFIVARPLPQAIIGKTVLATYGDDDGRRHYTATKWYGVNLFGMPLGVESMAFQEQDRVVAACATVALWSCFQKTSEMFGTAAPRPPRVTADATQSIFAKRVLPSDGLTSSQICSAIRQNGLEPEVFVADKLAATVPLVSLMYGYLSYGLPLLMIARIQGYTDQAHAFAFNGFSQLAKQHAVELILPPDPQTGACQEAPRFTGARINELYAHDDQIGPFSHLYVHPPTVVGKTSTFTGSWPVPRTEDAAVIEPLHIIVPIYKKIRLSYIEAYLVVTQIRAVLEKTLLRNNVSVSYAEWDLRLTDTSAYKEEIGREKALPSDRVRYLLCEPQPRYFWRSTLTLAGTRVAEFLIDATEFGKSNPLFGVNYFHERVRTAFFSDLEALPTNSRFTPKLKETLLTEYRHVWDGTTPEATLAPVPPTGTATTP
jgi:hypothetical protein